MRQRHHLRHIAASRIAQHADTFRINAIFRRVGAQVADSRFTIDNRRRKRVWYRAVFRRCDDKSGFRQRHAHFDKFIPCRAGKAATREVDNGGL